MTKRTALKIAARYGLTHEFGRSYRQIKPWWKFWMSETEAAIGALMDWDLPLEGG